MKGSWRVVLSKQAEVKRNVELAFGKREVRLQIGDDGRRFMSSKPPRRGMGIHGMRERAEEIGGKCELRSRPGKGTRVTVKFPVPSTGYGCAMKKPDIGSDEQIRVIVADDHPVVREHVLKKLGAGGRMAAIRIALERGIVHLG